MSDLRKGGPLVEMNCAGLPQDLMESEIFAHEAGAFTGAKGRHRGYMEQANGGALFMDKIGDMPMNLQAKLLKAIEDKKIRRRVIKSKNTILKPPIKNPLLKLL